MTTTENKYALHKGVLRGAYMDYMFYMPLGRLELPFLAPEANALSTELQGRVTRFYHHIEPPTITPTPELVKTVHTGEGMKLGQDIS